MSTGVLQQRVKTVPRDSNIELYRIISMLFIIAHHYVVNSGLRAPNGPIFSDVLAPQSQFLLLFGAWGKIGINCFVLITGYFMCTSNISAKKFAKLYLEVTFYRIAVAIAFQIAGLKEPYTFGSFMQSLILFRNVGQNFTGTFLLFYLCIPFLNILIKNMTEKQHLKATLLLLVIYVLFGTIQTLSVDMNYVSWFIVLYFIASYVRLYPKKLFDSKAFWGLMTVVSVGLSAFSVVACSRYGAEHGVRMSYEYVTDSNTFLALLTGLSSFMFFKNIKIRYSKIINAFSATTFGVLLIHSNSQQMRDWLWKDTLDNVGMYSSPYMPLHAIGSVFGVFIVCSLIDMVRIHAIEKPFFKLWDACWPRIVTWCRERNNRLREKRNVG